jgi:hypothetical protein
MDPSGGYIRLHRRLLQNPIWTQLAPAVLKVAIYFLLRANYRPAQWYDGSSSVDIPAGSFITSYAHAAKDCAISVQQVRDAFGHLFRTQFATYRRTHRWTLVTVVNWSGYQASPDDAEHTGEHRIDPAKNRQGTTDKNVRSKEVTTCASNRDARVDDSRSSVDDPPFGTTEPDASAPAETAHRAKPSRELTAEQDRWFTTWWAEYWLHKAKKAAREAFQKHVRTEERFRQVMAATHAQKPEELTKEPSKRPHGATWLNGERWEDETASQAPAMAQDDYPDY